MEDFKTILYILAIVGYFIFTAWRKAFKTPDEKSLPPELQKKRPRERPIANPQPQTPTPRQQRPAPPATSFEDILREMQSKMERANEKAKQPVEDVKPTYRPAPQPISQERTSARELSLEVPEQSRLAERASVRRASELAAAAARPRVTEQPNRYAALLQNPQSAREAFILSEIFNRKQY